MADIVQQRFFTSTNGTGLVQDLTFAGAVTPGSTILCIMFVTEDVTAVNVNGMAGSPAATNDYTQALAVNTARVWRYTNADASATGFRVTTATSHLDIRGWIVEVSGLAATSPFTAGATFPDDFGPVELDATASVSAAGDVAFAYFKDVPLANITSTRSGFTQSSESASTDLLQTNLNSGAGTVTAGASLSSNGFSSAGFVVTYKASAGVPDPNRGPTDLRATKKHRRRQKGGSPIGAPVALLQGLAVSPASVLGLGVLWPPATSGFTVAVGQAQEQDQAQAIAVSPRRRLLAQVSESDLAQLLTRRKVRVLGQVVQTDTAQAISRRKAKAVGQVLESDTAQALTRNKARPVGQVSEQDLAQTITASTSLVVAVGQALEQDSAQAVSKAKAKVVAHALESDTAQAVGKRKTRAVGQAAESDAAQAAVRSKARTLGLVLEQDQAQSVSRAASLSVGQVSEQDLAQAVGKRKTRALAQVSESDLAQALVRSKRRAVAQAFEQDASQALTRRKALAAAHVQEQDTAQPIQFAGNKVIGVTQAVESDTSQAITRRKTRALAQAAEQDQAQTVARRKARALTQAQEQDAAQAIATVVDKTILVGRALESDASQPVSARRSYALGLAQEQDSAQPMTGRQSYPLGLALEIDLAQLVEVTGGRPPLGVRLGRQLQAGDRPQAVQTTARELVAAAFRPSARSTSRPPALSTRRR